jgi:cysteine-rich repeat protein
MTRTIRIQPWAPTIVVTLMLCSGLLALPLAASQSIASHVGPPAGQKCPDGRNVIGFDAGGNIICSGDCGNAVVDAGESCDDGNTVSGDGCSAACQPEEAGSYVPPARPAAETSSPAVAAAGMPAGPVISDVEPTNVVYGKSGVTVTIEGAGFDGTSVVLFNGERYQTTVDPSGTRLTFRPETAGLTIGAYPITVRNGSGQEATRKRGLVIY